jgi:23S rRNA (pseudouridine1915-N3)-methyltransferase
VRIKIIAFGEKLPGWIQNGIDDYVKRFPLEWKIDMVILPTPKRTHSTISKFLLQEGQLMLPHCNKESSVIALDERGSHTTTMEFTQKLTQMQQERLRPTFLIGGPDGLAPECLARARDKLSLSAMTLPHALARLLLVEQLYRAFSILTQHPYHRI